MWIERRIGPQAICQRLYAGLFGNHALGAALGLKWQVQIFQVLLGGGLVYGHLKLGGELALIGNAFEDGGTAIFHLTQVAQTVFKFTQLNIVQAAGYFFAVTGNEWHRGAAI